MWWGKPAHLLQPYNKIAPKPHLRSAPLLEEVQKGLQLDPASEDPAADSGLKAVSLLKHNSLLARSTPLAASSEWSMCKLQVEFTGLVLRRANLSSRDRVQRFVKALPRG